jgi:hypothetical protein
MDEVPGHWPKFPRLKIMAWQGPWACNLYWTCDVVQGLNINGEVMFRVLVRGLTLDKMQSPHEQKRRQELDKAIKMKLGKGMHDHELKLDPDFADFVTPTHDCYEDKKEPALQMIDIDDLDEHDVDTYDHYAGKRVQLSIGDKIQTGKVTGRKRGLNGVARGKASANPILYTRTYNVEFPDGRSEEYTTNVIAGNMYAKCDEATNSSCCRNFLDTILMGMQWSALCTIPCI